MSDLVLSNITSGYNLSLINSNFQAIQDKINNFCLQTSQGDNVMSQDLDMNSHSILNMVTNFSNNGSMLTVGDAKSHFYQIGLVPSTTNDGDAVSYGQVGQMIAASAGGTDPANVALYSVLASTTSGSGASLVGVADTGGLYTATTVEGALQEVQTNLNNLANSDGSSKVGFIQSAIGAVARSLQDKNSDYISVKDFGAVGDGVTDDTTAVRNALAHCQKNSKTLFFPSGTYLVDTITYGRPVGNYKVIDIVGEGTTDVTHSTSLKKKTADGLNLFEIGNTTGFTGFFRVQGIEFQGIGGNTPAAMQITAGDRVVFRDCRFTGAGYGIKDLGGVSNKYDHCVVIGNVVGAYFRAAPSPSTSVSSNNNTLDGCIITGNSDTGVNFAEGHMLNILNCDIEGNGTSGTAGSCGLYVDGGVSYLGVNVTGTWFENNGITGSVYLKSGRNSFRNCLFVANTTATYDLYVNGGTYDLSNVFFASAKTNNLFEEAAVGSGNTIVGCTIPGKTIDASKTTVLTGTTLSMRNGNVPVVASVTTPLLQRGSGTPTGGVLTVTFPVAFTGTPTVVASVRGSSTASVVGTQISGTSATGFTVTVTFSNGSSVSTTNAIVDWIALGQG